LDLDLGRPKWLPMKREKKGEISCFEKLDALFERLEVSPGT
jgi:hypothetical protein